MKTLLLILAGLVVLVAVLALIGSLLPRGHRATRAVTLRQPPEKLFAAVRDFTALPTWRSDVKSVELLPSQNGVVSYREVSKHGPITYRVKEERAGQLLVLEIADDGLPYGGTWTFGFVKEASGATVRITEDGFVKPPLFRFLARFVFGYASTMEGYLRALGKKFGEDVTPRP
jgi:uncharacterized protein YndB with AHSA1/START domain